MISKKGYNFIKKTNEDASYDPTSKPGPSSETGDEDRQKDKGGVASSSPAALELSKIECLFYNERSKSKRTLSCPKIPNNEVPKRIRDSWSDIISELKRRSEGSDKQNGGEESNRRSSVDESYQRNGGEEGNRRSSVEGSYQQNGDEKGNRRNSGERSYQQNGDEEGNRRNSGEGSCQQNGDEEGNRRNSGEGRVQLVLGEVRTNRWARFKNSFFNCARWMINSGCLNFLLALYPWLALVTLVIEWFYRNQCIPIPAITTALVLFGVLFACVWFCCLGFTDRCRCRRCWDWNKYVLFTLFSLFVVLFIAEIVHLQSVECETPYFDLKTFLVFFLIVVVSTFLLVIGAYFFDIYVCLRTEERIPLRTATHEEGHNGDGRQPEAEEQV